MSIPINSAAANIQKPVVSQTQPAISANNANASSSASSDGLTRTQMSLKTPSGVNRMEEIVTGFANVADYTRHLQSKYSYMNSGTNNMNGVPTNVVVSAAFLEKARNDPEAAAYLEENLAAVPDGLKSLQQHSKMMPGSPTVTSYSVFIGDDGNITTISSCTNDPDGKIARENANKRAQKLLDQQKQLQEAQKKKLEAKRLAEKKAEKAREKERTEEAAAAKSAEEKARLEALQQPGDYTVNVTDTSMINIINRLPQLFAAQSATGSSMLGGVNIRV